MNSIKSHIQQRMQAIGFHIQFAECKIIEQVLFRLIIIRVKVYKIVL